MRVAVKPEMLRWACERAGHSPRDMAARIPQLTAWECGEKQPTLRQLEEFANATHTPVGFLFLQEPPVEQVPIPDFRTVDGAALRHPSPDLLDTIYLCQQRQEWYRDFARMTGESAVEVVGAATLADDIEGTAATIRQRLGFDLDERRSFPTWTEALRSFVDQADELGVLVMVSGVVGNNNTRKLDPDEFRGFCLADDLAPLVFINGADTKSAQMFTLAHELAHLWLGETALSNLNMAGQATHRVERWCNAVAAEVLVPLEALHRAHRAEADLGEEVHRLARVYKVSTLVVLRRLRDAGALTEGEFLQAYGDEVALLRAVVKKGGGNFYLTQAARVSKRFASALVSSAMEGRTSFTEAFRMLGVKKLATFRELGGDRGAVRGLRHQHVHAVGNCCLVSHAHACGFRRPPGNATGTPAPEPPKGKKKKGFDKRNRRIHSTECSGLRVASGASPNRRASTARSTDAAATARCIPCQSAEGGF